MEVRMERILVDLSSAKASNGEPLRGTVSYGKVGDAVRAAAATGAKVILPSRNLIFHVTSIAGNRKLHTGV